MTTQNACIYHCITCGRIEHTELGAEPPQCCGQAMTKTCEETNLEGDVESASKVGDAKVSPPGKKGPEKPR